VVLPGEVIVTEIVDCDGCAAELEVIAVAPVLLALAPEVEEDWGSDPAGRRARRVQDAP